MTEICYSILALWLDENGFYPGEDDEMFFPPAVSVLIEWQIESGGRQSSYLDMNFLCGEDFAPEEYLC